MRARLDRRWIIGTAATALVLSAMFFALSSTDAGAATCDISRYVDESGTIDTTSYLQCAVPTVSDDDVQPGATVRMSGGGYASNSNIDLELHSDPISLGSVTADARGNFSTEVSIPRNAPAGSHELWAIGVDPAGNVLTNVLAITVSAAGSGNSGNSGSLPVTGGNPGPYLGIGLALLVLGGAAVWGARQERSTTDA